MYVNVYVFMSICREVGTYEMCFGNEMSRFSAKVIACVSECVSECFSAIADFIDN